VDVTSRTIAQNYLINCNNAFFGQGEHEIKLRFIGRYHVYLHVWLDGPNFDHSPLFYHCTTKHAINQAAACKPNAHAWDTRPRPSQPYGSNRHNLSTCIPPAQTPHHVSRPYRSPLEIDRAASEINSAYGGSRMHDTRAHDMSREWEWSGGV
jgi:hypothetical protein